MNTPFNNNPSLSDAAAHFTIPTLFKTGQLKKTDQATIYFGDQTLSFQELEKSSDNVACVLLEHGVAYEELIVVLMERSIDAITSQLAILKTGAAYLPLSPQDFPLSRILSILEDSQAKIIITHKKHQKLIETLSSNLKRTLSCLFIDELPDSQDQKITPSLVIRSDIKPDNLAYVMYTSGSTGKPKGVMITHRNIISSVKNTNYFEINQKDAMLHAAPISFDAATFEIWGALLNGIDLHIIPEHVVNNFQRFSSYVRQRPITIAWLTSSLFNLLVESCPNFFENLQQLLVGGEALSPKHINRVRKHYPKLKIRNNYGPTENTIFSTSFLIDASYEENIPIGSAISHKRSYILDDQLQPVRPQITGQLYVAGEGLARGYLNLPDETNKKFLDDPFCKGYRMYATGDLCRYNDSGHIEYLGRFDDQVKIRGHRIELGEIESVLERCPKVHKAVVLYKELASDIMGLVAYIDYQDCSISQIKSHAQLNLPNYMVPSHFERIEHFPITPNVKLDRKALMALPLKKVSTLTLPSQNTRKLILSACAKSLELKSINPSLNYFDQGGNSLSGTSLVIELEHLLDIEVPLHLLYEHSVVEEFATKIETIYDGNSEKLTYQSPAKDLSSEALLNVDLRLNGRSIHKHPHAYTFPVTIFLTGCTGFFGAFLLKELLSTTNATLCCLVRARDESHALNRIQETMKKYKIPFSSEELNRVNGVPGDLTKDNLGLTQCTYDVINQTTDMIIHNGAVVNYVDSYDTLKKPNVHGTYEIIKLSSTKRIIPIHYVSSISVFETLGFFTGRQTIYENENVDSSKNLVKLGYSQSKWVAEKMMENARLQGLPINIYRSAYIMGHSETGVSNTTDHIARYIAGCIEMGCAPKLHEYASLSPVDQLSKAFCHIAMNISEHGKTFHLCNPSFVTVNEIYQKIQEFGFPLDIISYNEWKERLKKVPTTNPLYPLLSLHIHAAPGHKLTLPELYEHNARFDCSLFKSALNGSGISIDLSDPTIFERWLYYYVEEGLISHATFLKVFPASPSKQSRLTA